MEKPLAGSTPMLYFPIRTPSTGVRLPKTLFHGLLWLGHEHVDTTNIYIHADLALKERAIDRTTPAHVRAGRYRPPDPLLAFLEGL